MKKLLTLLAIMFSSVFAAAQPAAELRIVRSFHTSLYIPDRKAASPISTYKVRQFNIGANSFYAEDTIDNGWQFAERYGFRKYRIRNEWAYPFSVVVHQTVWHDSAVISEEDVECGGECYPELNPSTFIGGFSRTFDSDPTWGNAYYSTSNSSETRISILGGDSLFTYYVRVHVGVYVITDRTPDWGSSSPPVVPYSSIRIPNGYAVDPGYTFSIWVPGDGSEVAVTPSVYPSAPFYKYALSVNGIEATSPR